MADKRIRRLIEIIFDRQSAQKVEGDIKSSLQRAGREGGDNFRRELQAVFNTRMADLRVQLSKGLIDQGQFRQQASEAAQAFNEELIARMEQFRAEGKMTDAEYVKLARSIKKVGDDGGKAIGGLRQGMQHLQTAVLSVTGALAGLFAINRIRAFIGESTNLAGRYETLGVTLNQVGQTAGYTQQQLDETTAALQRTGISMIGSRQSAAQLISANVDLAHATDLARIAQDAAVIANTNSSEAFERLVNGIASGQVQTLRTLGLNVNFQRSYQQLAAQLGKNVDQLTEVERAQARTNAVIEAGAGIVGAYEASLETAGKQKGSNVRLLEDLQVKLGQVFLPTFTNAVFGYADALKEVHTWLDSIEQSQIEEWGKRVAGVFDTLVATVRELTRRLRALGEAIAIVAGITVLGRLRTAVIAANAATVTFSGTLRGLLTLIGPKGWVVIGVATLTEMLYRFRHAARAAADETDTYRDALRELNREQLIAEALNLDRQLSALQAMPQTEWVREQIDKVYERAGKVADALRELQEIDPPTLPDLGGDPNEITQRVDGLKEEVRLLATGHELRILSSEEFGRAYQLAVDTRAELARANLTLERRIELTQRLAALEEITGERVIRPQIAVSDSEIPTAGALHLELFPVTEARAQLTEWQMMLSEMAEHSSTVAMYMERSFEGFFTALATGFDTTREGFHSLADAAQGIGLSIVAGLAGGMRDYHMAEAMGKLAAGIFPGDPRALLASAKHIAAAGLFGALERLTANAGRRSAVPAPVGAPGPIGSSAADSARRDPAPINIWVDPFNPGNPVHARQIGQGMELNVRLGGRPEWAR